MNVQFIDALAHRTRGLHNRRTSLQALAAVAMATAAAPSTTEAKQRAGKKARQRCKLQVPTCEVTLSAVCQPGPDVQACLDATALCCGFLRTCDAAAAMACVIQNFIA